MRQADLDLVALTRRIPVIGWRMIGWRTRAVGHATESLIGATALCDRAQHGTVDVQRASHVVFVAAGSVRL